MSFNMDHADHFRHAFHLPNDRRARATQRKLIVEEFGEFLEAEKIMIGGFVRNETDCLKELADLVYVCFQFASCMDWDLDQALLRVHESNLSKLNDEGQPEYRDDGKVLKGKNYHPPVLNDLVKPYHV